jgi:hypothetical protein
MIFNPHHTRRTGFDTSEHLYNSMLSISARNLINHVNDAPPVGVIGSPFFLKSTAIAGGFAADQTPANNRRIDLQLCFSVLAPCRTTLLRRHPQSLVRSVQ